MLQTLINLARPLFLSVLPQPDSQWLEQINISLARMIKLVFALLITSVLLVIILTFLIDRALTQLDAAQFTFTPAMILLSVLLIIDAAALAFLLLKKGHASKPTPLAKQSSPLENAVSVLILDVVNERQAERRERNSASATDHH